MRRSGYTVAMLLSLSLLGCDEWLQSRPTGSQPAASDDPYSTFSPYQTPDSVEYPPLPQPPYDDVPGIHDEKTSKPF